MSKIRLILIYINLFQYFNRYILVFVDSLSKLVVFVLKMLVNSLLLVFLSFCCCVSADLLLDGENETDTSEWNAIEELDSEEDGATMPPVDLQPIWNLSDNQPEDNSFEIREYEASTWIVASLPCTESVKATGLGFLKLFLYINRYNYENLEYPLVDPIVTSFKSVSYPAPHDVSVSINPDQKSSLPLDCWKNYTVEMYLPTDFFSVIAEPMDEEISIMNKSSATYAVMAFDGIASIGKCRRHAHDLMTSLKSSEYELMEENGWKCADYRTENGDSSSEIWIELDI